MKNPMLNQLEPRNNLMDLLKSKNPNEMYNQLMQTNPKFRQFVDSNKGKTPEQIARENNIDMGMVNRFLRG